MGGFLFTNFQFCEVNICDLQITQTTILVQDQKTYFSELN